MILLKYSMPYLILNYLHDTSTLYSWPTAASKYWSTILAAQQWRRAPPEACGPCVWRHPAVRRVHYMCLVPLVSPRNIDPVSLANSSPPPLENILLHSWKHIIFFKMDTMNELFNIILLLKLPHCMEVYSQSSVDRQIHSCSPRCPGSSILFSYKRWSPSSHHL